jgi:hypothetical protein
MCYNRHKPRPIDPKLGGCEIEMRSMEWMNIFRTAKLSRIVTTFMQIENDAS